MENVISEPPSKLICEDTGDVAVIVVESHLVVVYWAEREVLRQKIHQDGGPL